jgi:hypothetical protein
VSDVDRTVAAMTVAQQDGNGASGDQWAELSSSVAELDRLVGDGPAGKARWQELRRHINFAEQVDLADIVRLDWPSVRTAVQESLYGDYEPIPTTVDDLGVLARARPQGAVSTTLGWDHIDDSAFERLIYELVKEAPGHENANLLMNTNAPDRGRDVTVYRVISDPLGETLRHRLIVQCKHWRTKAVGISAAPSVPESLRLRTLNAPPIAGCVTAPTPPRGHGPCGSARTTPPSAA